MNTPRLENLTPNEFEAMLEQMLSEDFDKVTPTQFFGAFAAQDEFEPEVIEPAAQHNERNLR